MPPKFGGGPKCAQCQLAAYPFESVSYSGSVYHSSCFCCQLCKQRITNVVSVTELNGAVFHKNCFGRRLQAAGGKFAAAAPKATKWLSSVSLSTHSLDASVAERVFNEYDQDQDGFLNHREATFFVEEWCKQLSVPFTSTVLASFFMTFDADKDGKVSKRELLGGLSTQETKVAQLAPSASSTHPSALETKSLRPPPPSPATAVAAAVVTPAPSAALEIKTQSAAAPTAVSSPALSSSEEQLSTLIESEIPEPPSLSALVNPSYDTISVDGEVSNNSSSSSSSSSSGSGSSSSSGSSAGSNYSSGSMYDYTTTGGDEEEEEAASHYTTYSNYGNEEQSTAGDYDEITQTIVDDGMEKKINSQQERSLIPPDTSFNWQERFEAILKMSSQTSKEKLEKAKALQALNNEFCEQAKLLTREVVRDSFLPKAERQYKPLTGMGVAGGEKYLAKGMFIKMPKDLGLGIYGGDMGAGKAAKHEINSLQALLDCDIPELFFPLMCCVTYQGFRLVCSSLISGIGKNTLAYGSQDAGYTIHCSDPDLNHKVEQACMQLGLAAHNSISNDKKCQVLYGPADLEGHVVKVKGQASKKMYLLDFARLMPPESPHARKGMSVNALVYHHDGTTTSTVTANVNQFVGETITGSGVLKRVPLSEGILFFREPSDQPQNIKASELANREINSVGVLVTETGRIFYELLRPEAVKACPTPLSSDAFSGFGSCKFCFGVTHFCPHGGQRHNISVANATDWVKSSVSQLASKLDCRRVNLADCSALVRELHRQGINLRWLGSLLEAVQTPYIKRLIFMEMVCRTVRQVLAAKQRRVVESAARSGVKLDVLEASLKAVGLKLFNLVLDSSEEAHSFWENDLVLLLKKKYFRTRQDTLEEIYFRSENSTLGREFLLKFPLFTRLQQICCFKFTPEINQHLFHDPTEFERKPTLLTLSDVVGCEVHVQRLQFDESINFILHELAHFKDDKNDELRPSLIRAMSFKTEVASARMAYHQMAIETFGMEHPYVIDSFFKLSLDLRRTHSIDLALKMATQGLRCCVKTYGSFSHQYVMGLTTVGEIEMEALLYPAAITTFGQALECANRIHGGKEGFHPLVAKLCAYLGRLNMLHGDKQAGVLYLGRSYSVYERLYGGVSDYLTPVVTMGKGEQIGTALAEMAFAIRSVCDENGMIEQGEMQDGVLMLAGDLARGLPPGAALSGATIIERIRTMVTIIEDIDGVPRGYFMVDSDESPTEPSTPLQAEAKAKAAPPPFEGPCGVCSALPQAMTAGKMLTFWVRSLSAITCTVGVEMPKEEKKAAVVVPPKHVYDVTEQVPSQNMYSVATEGAEGGTSAYSYTVGEEGNTTSAYTTLGSESEKKGEGEKKEESEERKEESSGELAYSSYQQEADEPANEKEGGDKESAVISEPASVQVTENTHLPGLPLEMRPFISRILSPDGGPDLYRVRFLLGRAGRFAIQVQFHSSEGPQTTEIPLTVEPGVAYASRTQLRVGQTPEGFEFVIRVRDAFGNSVLSTSETPWRTVHGLAPNSIQASVTASLQNALGIQLNVEFYPSAHPNRCDFMVNLPSSRLRQNCNYSFECRVNRETIRSCPLAFQSPESSQRYCSKVLFVTGIGETLVPVCSRCTFAQFGRSTCVVCSRPDASVLLRYCANCSMQNSKSCYTCGARNIISNVMTGYAKVCNRCSIASKCCLGLVRG